MAILSEENSPDEVSHEIKSESPEEWTDMKEIAVFKQEESADATDLKSPDDHAYSMNDLMNAIKDDDLIKEQNVQDEEKTEHEDNHEIKELEETEQEASPANVDDGYEGYEYEDCFDLRSVEDEPNDGPPGWPSSYRCECKHTHRPPPGYRAPR